MRFRNRAIGQGKKYNNHKCEADGFKFDSLKERQRYFELKALRDAGELSQLNVHPCYFLEKGGAFSVVIKGDKRNTRARYIPDFSYADKNGNLVIEDVKSKFMASDKYFKLKRAIFEAIYQQDVRVVI